jgi:cystathionine beta-lyase family protein involved in aluminum resistance
MLSHHLQGALEDLRDLIAITEADIEDIKEAQHDPQFERLSLKEEKLQSFEAKKAMIDHEIAKLIASNPEKNLSDLLTQEQHILLDELKSKLNNLHDVNKRYAKMVVVVSNLYNSFLEKIVPTEMQGYQKVASKNAAILEVRV